MARNWSKLRSRDQAMRSRRAEYDNAAYLRDLEAAPPPSKADLRLMAESAVHIYKNRIKHLPTIVNLRCPKCRHRGKATVQPKQTPGSDAQYVALPATSDELYGLLLIFTGLCKSLLMTSRHSHDILSPSKHGRLTC